MIKQYRVMYGFHDWECTIEINTELFTPELLQQYLDFFCWEYNKKGHLYEEYLKLLAKHLISDSLILTKDGMISIFKNREGFPPLDGSVGITLVSCDHLEFQDERFKCKIKDN